MVTRYTPRERRSTPARHLPDELPEGLQRRRGLALQSSREPFVGVTTDGHPIRGLYPLRDTGLTLEDVTWAAEMFLTSLDAGGKDAVTFTLDAPEWRMWSNIHPFLARHGLLLETLDDDRRNAALAIARAALSPRGYETARNVMKLNETIREITGSDAEYGEWLYWIGIFGDPSDTSPWGFQIDGHHLNLNFTVVGSQLVATPMFMGSEPVVADAGKYAGTAVFRDEERQGAALMTSLSAGLRRRALIGEDLPGDVFTSAFRDNFEMRYEGLPAGEMTSAQQMALLALIDTYVGRVRSDQALERMHEVRAHLDQTYFAWIGGTGDGSPFYYRVHSPVILIEFDHQSGTALESPRPSRDHIHTVVRTPNGNDYGRDLLRQHHARHRH